MKYCKLIDVCDFQGGSQPPKSDWIKEPKDGYIRMLQIRDFTQNYGKPEYVKITSAIKTCKSDDILIARYGASVGKILTGLSGAYNVAIMKTIPKEETLLKRYLYYFLKSNLFQNYILNVGSRAAQAGFNKEDLAGINIQVHSIETQKNIILQLENIDKLINLRKKAIEKCNNLIKSQFVEMFENDAVVKKQLKSIAKIGSSKRIYASEYKNSGIPFYRSKEIRELGTGLKPSVELFIDESKYNYVKDKFGVPKKGDILVAAIGATIGYMWIVDDSKFYYKDGNLINISPFDKVSSIYLKYVLEKIINDYKIKNASGSAQLAMTIEKIEKFEIPVPPLELQSKFAHIVEQIDKQKFEFEKSLKKLEELQASLMQEYFG